VTLTGGNRNDITQLIRSWTRSRRSAAGAGAHDASPMSWWPTTANDHSYDHDKYRTVLRQRGIRPADQQARHS
jgi:hypothetical protein